jgi:5-methylcytosine-specific restriction endonuclease McrA
MKRTPLKKVSTKQRAELARRRKVRMDLEVIAGGRCQHCGRLPDWRGLQMHHKIPLSQGGETSVENCELWTAPCHFGSDGHRTE